MAKRKTPPLSSFYELSQTEIRERIRSLRTRLSGPISAEQRTATLEEMLVHQDELMERMRRQGAGR